MSSIPNSAMPHAKAHDDAEDTYMGRQSSIEHARAWGTERMNALRGWVREQPRSAALAAAGVGLAALLLSRRHRAA